MKKLQKVENKCKNKLIFIQLVLLTFRNKINRSR